MSPDRKRTLDFIDWVLTNFRQEWMDAPENMKKTAFEKINHTLEMRVEVMKLINYDHAIAPPNENTSVETPTPKRKRKEPPTIH